MAILKFTDTRNMVAFLSKPTETEGFEQIIAFLNAHPIKYALTINPTIYISYIEQFWSIVKAKTINGEVQLNALVDGKKIIVNETSVRRDLQLEDVEGIDCLPNSTIFEELTMMGAKTTAWNEFSSTMASVIIFLATNQKFNFSKYIFESIVRNLDNLSRKFLMYPRHKKPRKPKIKDTQVPQPSNPMEIVADETIHKELGDSLMKAATTASRLEAEKCGGPRCQETMMDTIAQTRFENVSKLSNDSLLVKDEDITLVNVQDDADNEMFDVNVLNGDKVFAEQEVTLDQALAALKSVKPKVKRDVIEEPNVPVNAASASIKVSAATTTTAIIPTSRKGIVITELEPEPMKKLSKKDQLRSDEEEAKIDVDHQLAERLQVQEQEELSIEEKATLFQQLLDKRRKHFTAKKHGRIQAQRFEVKRVLHAIQEMCDRAFKRVNTFEDFRTELEEGKEKRAGEELILESLKKTCYKLVKARYGIIKTVEEMDHLFWNDMKIMFEPHVEDEVWKLQNGYKVFEWKLYDSCGVHFLRMQSMQIYMLVEKKYPLTPPTLSMMLEKKLQIDYEKNGNSFKPVAQTTTNADGTSTEEKYKDAKTFFAAIQTRFGGNEATKKTQKTLLNQMYENFSAPSTESLDSIFNRLQKIVSQLAILGENI
ncbi:hypothetical protein Tco_0724153 [Tanacetum coccineum]